MAKASREVMKERFPQPGLLGCVALFIQTVSASRPITQKNIQKSPRVIQVVLCDCLGSCQDLGLATRAIFRGLFVACAVYRSRFVNAFVNRQTWQ